GGAITVAIGGQTPLVIGDKALPISTETLGNGTAILDANGRDITTEISQGKLGALIEEKNSTIPGYMADLNAFAQGIADTINGQLAQGLDQNGNPPAVPLFSYDGASETASTIGVNSLTPDQIAAASGGAAGGNGNAVALTQLAGQATIGSYTFTQF